MHKYATIAVLVLLAAGNACAWPPCPSGQFGPCGAPMGASEDMATTPTLTNNNDEEIILSKTYALTGRVPEQAAASNPSDANYVKGGFMEPSKTLTASGDQPAPVALGVDAYAATLYADKHPVLMSSAQYEVLKQAAGSGAQPSNRRLLRA